MKIDVHVHLAGVGTGDSGCRVSPEFRSRLTFRLLRRLHRISAAQMRDSVDQDWAARIASLVAASELDGAVVLGFDGIYGPDGEMDPVRSQMVVPPAWIFEVCRRHPGLLPGPSIHPLRRDALELLDESIEAGAVLIKWLPSAQGIDPADRRLSGFYERMAAARLPLLVHSGGGELTFREMFPEFKDLARLRVPLDAGVPVICAHSGTRVMFSRDADQIPLMREMLVEYPHLWLDNSGMANPTRFAHLARLAKDPSFAGRTLQGSDYPIPSQPALFIRSLGVREAVRLQRLRNPFDREIALKRALGYPDATLRHAMDVLRAPERWVGRRD
jgi:predicted TIM-barrel fold metal-dependent hydrolase